MTHRTVDLAEFRSYLFGNRAYLLDLLGVDRTTLHRWIDGTRRIPWPAFALLKHTHEREVAAVLGPDWGGWRFGRDGLLYAPGHRQGWSPGEILAIPYLYGQIRALQDVTRSLAAIREPLRLPDVWKVHAAGGRLITLDAENDGEAAVQFPAKMQLQESAAAIFPAPANHDTYEER